MVDKNTTMVGFATATEKTMRTMSEKLEELFKEIASLKVDINHLDVYIREHDVEIERLQEKKEE
jgi:prefoldin subunit 5